MNIQGIEVNPELRPKFWNCPQEQRPREEMNRWWNRPFVKVDNWESVRADANYEAYCARIPERHRQYTTREAWEANAEEKRRQWFEWFPEGVRYWVMRLDDGAWDRPSEYSVHTNLQEAVDAAIKLKGQTVSEALEALRKSISVML